MDRYSFIVVDRYNFADCRADIRWSVIDELRLTSDEHVIDPVS